MRSKPDPRPKHDPRVITLDGPSGTGKGTICYLLAKHLHWHMLDSGCLYRALALAAREKGILFTEGDALVALAFSLDIYFAKEPQKKIKIILNGEDVSNKIKSEQCGQDASVIAVFMQVRKALLARQRAFAVFPGLVTDGRDMGTVVFPDADLKIFLHASAEERTMRRYLQLKESKIDVSLAEVVNELAKRDERDKSRICSPLIAAEDAVLVDTTGLSIIQVFNNVLQLVNERLPCNGADSHAECSDGK